MLPDFLVHSMRVHSFWFIHSLFPKFLADSLCVYMYILCSWFLFLCFLSSWFILSLFLFYVPGSFLSMFKSGWFLSIGIKIVFSPRYFFSIPPASKQIPHGWNSNMEPVHETRIYCHCMGWESWDLHRCTGHSARHSLVIHIT